MPCVTSKIENNSLLLIQRASCKDKWGEALTKLSCLQNFPFVASCLRRRCSGRRWLVQLRGSGSYERGGDDGGCDGTWCAGSVLWLFVVEVWSLPTVRLAEER